MEAGWQKILKKRRAPELLQVAPLVCFPGKAVGQIQRLHVSERRRRPLMMLKPAYPLDVVPCSRLMAQEALLYAGIALARNRRRHH